MIAKMEFTIANKALAFSMDLDPENSVPDNGILTYMQAGLPCEPETCQVLVRALREGDVAIDAGANVGFFTIMMSKLVGAKGRVIAIEPGGNNLPKLHRNLELNNCYNVTVIEKPLWASEIDVPFHLYQDGGSNSIWGKEGETSAMVSATTLDKICGDRKPTLMKMDIEGAETDAVTGCKMLAQHRPMIITEMNGAALKRAGSSPFKLRRALEVCGYHPYLIFDTGHLPARVPSNSRMNFTKPNANVLFSTPLDVGRAWPDVYV